MSAAAEPSALFDLATWLGRHQAFGLIASKCSAADAHALQAIRENKLYRALGLSWEEFCSRHAGCSCKTADQTISRLREFGESYFNLSQIVTITLPEYRALAPSIADNMIELAGERIPITRENGERIAALVHELRDRLEYHRPPFESVQNRLDRCLGEIVGAARRGLTSANRQLLIVLLDDAAARIAGILQKI